MARRKQQGITNRTALRHGRRLIETRHAKPKGRTRGVTKRSSDDIVHKLHIGTLSKHEMAATSAPAPRTDAVSTDGTTRLSSLARPRNGTQGWNDHLDRDLRAAFGINPRTALARFSKEHGIKRGVVKARAKTLGLLHVPTQPASGSVCADGAEELEPTIANVPPARAANGKKTPLAVVCPQGDTRLEILRKGKRGFIIVAGAAPEQIFGAGPNGLPICPTHDVEMLAAEPIEAAEAFRQVQAATPAQEPLFETSKEYNADGALVALDSLRQRIVTMRGVVDASQKQLAKHRKDLETLEEALLSGVEEFMKRRAAKQMARVTRDDHADVRANAICSFEQHVGQNCPLCRGVSRALAIAAIDAPLVALRELDSEAHRAAGVKANSIEPERLTDTAPRLVARAIALLGLHGVPEAVVETWPVEERLAVIAWLEGDQTTEAPAALGTPHIAAAAGEQTQCCRDCGSILLTLHEGGTPYPADARVGSHCSRDPHAAATPATPDAAVTT